MMILICVGGLLYGVIAIIITNVLLSANTYEYESTTESIWRIIRVVFVGFFWPITIIFVTKWAKNIKR